jgi:hypothetical protein
LGSDQGVSRVPAATALVGPVPILHQAPPEFVSLADEDVEVIDYWFNERPREVRH